MRIPLAAQRAENQAPGFRGAGGGDGGAPRRLHRGVRVALACQFARIRVVPVGGQRGVVDHGGFEVEAAVAEVEEEVDGGVRGQARRRAAEDFARAEGPCLRDDGRVAGAGEERPECVQRVGKLDGADEGEGAAGGDVGREGREQVRGVDADADEDVEGRDAGDRDGDQAAVRVVHEEVAAEGPRGVVVDAAGAVGDVGHDEGGGVGAEARQNVGDGRREEEEPFGELQRDFAGVAAADAVDRFGDFEGVVGREARDRFVDGRVVEDGGWDLV